MMYKKITALCLAFVMVMSFAASPVFASDYQNASIITKQGPQGITIKALTTVVKYDKKDNSKSSKDDVEDVLESLLKRFMDSDDFNWATKSIEKLGAMGIFSGNGKGMFYPQNNISHAEAIAMVLKLNGYQKEAEAIKKQPEYFKNLSDPWSYGYLKLALDQGIIIPEEDGKFDARKPAQRHEIAKYVVRALGKRALALDNMDAKLKYKDASSVPSKSVGYVFVISELGIMQGSNNLFQPNKSITRAEMAVILDKAEAVTDEPVQGSTSLTGAFVAYDQATAKLTLSINNKPVVYDINPHTPVYKDATYYSLDYLKSGDMIKVIVDSQKRVIFVEFKQTGTPVPAEEKLSVQTVVYDALPQAIKDKVDALKTTQSYTAFKYEQSIYLIAARGQMSTGGYAINIKDVYKEKVSSDKYNLKAVVEFADPGSAMVTQAITYPYHVVKLNYFNGIEKVNFVNLSNVLLAQTTINAIDIVELINGKIDSVDYSNRILKLLESDGALRSYHIPTNVEITLDNKASSFSKLTKNMTAAITRVNGVITKVAALPEAQVIEVIAGKIDSIDTVNRIVKIAESDQVVRAYYIPNNITILLNNRSVSLSSLMKDMTVALTRTNGVITKLEAANIEETISGKLDTVDTGNRVIKLVEADGVTRAYAIPNDVKITINNQTASFSSLAKDMPAVLTRTNGVITRLAATNKVETIKGKIDSVDAATSTVRLLESDNIVRAYTIPATAQLLLGDQPTALSNLAKGMAAVITKANGIITKLAAERDIQAVEGILITTTSSQSKIYISVKVGSVINAYEITANTAVFYNNQSTTIQSIPFNSTIIVKIENGAVIEVRNK